MKFKVWLEQKEQNDDSVRKLYKAVEKRFIGEVGDLSDPISKVGEAEFGKQKGSKQALKILNKMGVLDQLKNLGTEWSQRVSDTISYLQGGTKIGTIGDMFNHLFGEKHGQFRSKGSGKISRVPIKMKPPRNDSTEQVPGANQSGPPPGGGMPSGPPMGGSPMPPMGGSPGGGMPQMPPPGMGG